MRPVRTLLGITLITLLAVLATGCGPADASTGHRSDAVKWGAIGDSITYGWGSSQAHLGWGIVDTPTAYPVRAGIPAEGRPGQCLVATGCGFGLYPALDDTFAGELGDLKARGVNAVVVEIGVNDLGHGIADQRLEAAYRHLISTGAANGVRVVLSTITPGGPGHFVGDVEVQRERLNAWIRGRGPHVDYAAALGGDVLPAAFDSGDGLHPSDAGHAAMAQALDRFIASPSRTLHKATPTVCVRACFR